MATSVAVAAGILMLTGAIGLLGGIQRFGSTPEDVAEGFVRTLVNGDYNGAFRYLDPAANKDIDTVDLKHLALFIMMRSGQVHDIHGVRGWVRGRRAEASARLVTHAGGNWMLSLKMVRRRGSWSIAEIGQIQNASASPNGFGVRVPAPIAAASGIRIEINMTT